MTGFLQYSFETVAAMKPFYVVRLLGWRLLPDRRPDHGLQRVAHDPRRAATASTPMPAGPACSLIEETANKFHQTRNHREERHLAGGPHLITVSIGGLVQIIPAVHHREPSRRSTVSALQPLEVAGSQHLPPRGLLPCHSQQIRPFRDEVERYGHYSLAAESMYDNPFQWGSKRTGPDLARVGGRYSNDWHVAHLASPRAVVPRSSCRPIRPWPRRLSMADIADQLEALRLSACPTPTR